MRWVQLPFHISLKQSFALEDVGVAERYFVDFAAALEPVAVPMGDPEVVDGSVIWLPVNEDHVLRPRHDQLNQDLGRLVSDSSAPFDGSSYRFHLSLGFVRGSAATPRLINGVGLKKPRLNLQEAALFLFDEYEEGLWQFTTYRTARLGGAGRSRRRGPRTVLGGK